MARAKNILMLLHCCLMVEKGGGGKKIKRTSECTCQENTDPVFPSTKKSEKCIFMGKGTGEINGHEMHIQYKAAAACERRRARNSD